MRCPRPLTLTSVVVVAAVSLLAAGCGSNSPSSSSSGGQPAQAQLQQGQHDAVRFVQCLRSHGVTNVPDPTSASGHAFKDAVSGDAQSPAFRSAYTACTHLLPNGGPRSQSAAQRQSDTAALLPFARCLRSHGFPSFPDPTSSGQLTREMLAQAGIDLHQPAIVRVADACVSVTHGVITKATVARFVAGQ
jgi:hypothetical protein